MSRMQNVWALARRTPGLMVLALAIALASGMATPALADHVGFLETSVPPALKTSVAPACESSVTLPLVSGDAWASSPGVPGKPY